MRRTAPPKCKPPIVAAAVQGADEEEEDLDALLDKYSVEAAAQNERDAARAKARGAPRSTAAVRAHGLSTALPQSNKGFQLLKAMGYQEGQGLGKDKSGIAQPLDVVIKPTRAGLGVDEQARREKQAREQQQMEQQAKRVRMTEGAAEAFKLSAADEFASRRAMKTLRQAWKSAVHLEELSQPNQAPISAAAASIVGGSVAVKATGTGTGTAGSGSVSVQVSEAETAAAAAPPPPALATSSAARSCTQPNPLPGELQCLVYRLPALWPDLAAIQMLPEDLMEGFMDPHEGLDARGHPPDRGLGAKGGQGVRAQGGSSSGKVQGVGGGAAARAVGAIASVGMGSEVPVHDQLHTLLEFLRTKHHYCVHCGCSYTSGEDMSENCPGESEEDH